MSDNIIVAIRVRPFIAREKDSSSCWVVEQTNQIRQVNIDDKHLATYVYDRVYDQVSSTEEVYNDTAAPIVKAAMLGFHGTIFAYGQTSSGKTHTMTGDKDSPGIVQLAVEDIFNTIENSPEREFLIRVSYLEIYQENVVDLLGNLTKHLDIKENYHGTVFVENLKENVATSVEDVMEEMKKAEVNRHIGATRMNERSSRSHTIFRVIIESHLRSDESGKSDDVDDAVMVAHLNFVDLAGSENAKQTAASGQRLAESGAINKSLLSLSLVIGQLSTGSTFVNYRNSRLTRILQNALGGNSKTAIICTISPASLEQSVSTLRFATSAKSIKNKPVVNEVISGETMLKRYKKEIHELKKQLEEAKCASSKVCSDIRVSRSKEDKIEVLTRLFCVSSQLGGATGARHMTNREARRRETWCPGRGGMPLPPFLKAGGAHLPQPLLPPSMLPPNSPEPSTPPAKSEKAELEDKEKCHLEEIACLKQSRTVSKYKQQIAELEAKLQSATLEAEHKQELHLVEIVRLKQDNEEMCVELEAVKNQISEMQNLGREMIIKHNDQVAQLEDDYAIRRLSFDMDILLEQEKKRHRRSEMEKNTSANMYRDNADLEAANEKQPCLSCELHLVEIARLKQDNEEMCVELEAVKNQISEMQNLGREMIVKHNDQVAQLEDDYAIRRLSFDMDILLEQEKKRHQRSEMEKNTSANMYRDNADLEAANEKQPCLSCEHHLVEITRLTQSHADVVDELAGAREDKANMKAVGLGMIQKLKQQVADLESEMESTKRGQESAVCKIHVAKIARLKEDCKEVEEDLEMAQAQNTKLQHQVALLEAELKSTKNESQYYVTREAYENERQHLMKCCDEVNDELKDIKSKQALSDKEKKALLEQVHKVNQTNARIQMQVTLLEHELVQVQDPLNSRIKFFEQELDRLGNVNKQLKNEIRHLHNKQSNESFIQPREVKSSHKLEQGEREFLLQVEVQILTKKVEKLQAALDSRDNKM